MAISAIGNNVSSIYQSLSTRSQPETLEQKTATGRDNQQDSDADGTSAASTTSNVVKPTVNTQGQPLGQLLNTRA